MKKLYSIITLLVIFIFLTTINPKKSQIFSEKKDIFFGITELKIENTNLVDEKLIIEKLSKIYGRNIFFLKKKEIEEPLISIDFLDKVEVKKIYPNKIIIKIYESQPVGLLIKNNIKYLLDSSSNLILFDENIFSNSFPSIFGENAENEFVNFLNLLKKNNFPIKRIKSYYYFQIDRWDIQLFNNQTVKLPSNKISFAVKQAVELLERKDFDLYNIIDLRIDGKVITE